MRNERGAVIAELAITMPIFLALIAFILWVAVAANERQSITSATENAVRLAGTRGRGVVVQRVDGDGFSGTIPTIDRWQAGGERSSRIDELLLSSSDEDITLYDRAVADIYGEGSTLQDLPSHYAYAIAYANEAMRLSVGNQLRYPCVEGETKDLKEDEACLICRPVNPLTLDDSRYISSEDAQVITFRVIALQCDYSPSMPIINMMQRLLGLVSGKRDSNAARFKMSRTATFDAFLR